MCVAEGYREYERGPISIHLSEPSPSVLQETNRYLVAVSSECVIKIIFNIFGKKSLTEPVAACADKKKKNNSQRDDVKMDDGPHFLPVLMMSFGTRVWRWDVADGTFKPLMIKTRPIISVIRTT